MPQDRNIYVVVKSVIVHKGKSLVIQRALNDEIGAGEWECAGGGIDFGESLENSLLREIQEEVGLTVTIDRLLYATTFHTARNRQVVLLMYVSHSPSDKVRLSNEHINYQWVTVEAFQQRISPPILKDFEKYGVFSLPIWGE